MNETAGVSPSLKDLRERLDATDGVQAQFTSDREIAVAFQGRRIGSWAPDGSALAGDFACEGVVLCAASADEAYRLTIGRLA